MRRTILGLFAQPADSELESLRRGNTTIAIEDVQQSLDGTTVYEGTAAYEGEREVSAPKITETDDSLEITETTRVIPDHKVVDFFAVPDANPGFAAFNTSDNRFARNTLGLIADGIISDAAYNVDAIAEYLDDEYNANWWQVGWTDELDEESGVIYPEVGNDNEIVKHGLDRHKNQIGFHYQDGGEFLDGTIAASGYAELYTPESWGAVEMAAWIGNHLSSSPASPTSAAPRTSPAVTRTSSTAATTAGRPTSFARSRAGTSSARPASKPATTATMKTGRPTPSRPSTTPRRRSVRCVAASPSTASRRRRMAARSVSCARTISTTGVKPDVRAVSQGADDLRRR
ncbi:hypothetical protein [Halobacterium sp. KA-6]|uniref:hypothetical protein n=1 Tax=Halobacterium sp. KA-6 TaxID=2896368 RepID=UPI001E529D69|nr:hypothetical protein [Halobacterium sp. KA-6]MCD2204383.1 hypothetical protein [Halobacterium sp. KA-6]